MNIKKEIEKKLLEDGAAGYDNSICWSYKDSKAPYRNIRYNSPASRMSQIRKEVQLGWPVSMDDEHMLVTDQMSHCLVIGGTGTGKTAVILDNMVNYFASVRPDARPSLLITDPKGEHSAKHLDFLKGNGYTVMVIDARNPFCSLSYNPLQEIYKKYLEAAKIEWELLHVEQQMLSGSQIDVQRTYDEKKIQMQILRNWVQERIDALIDILIPCADTRDRGWVVGARNWAKGLLIQLLHNSTSKRRNCSIEQFTIANLNRIASERNDDFSYMDEFLVDTMLDPYIAAAKGLSTMCARQTRDSYYSSMSVPLSRWGNITMERLMATSEDFDLQSIASEQDNPKAIILITDDRREITNDFCAILISNLIDELVTVADSSPSRALKRDFVFLLDEFANIPRLNNLSTMITTLRSRRIWLCMAIQSCQQLQSRYADCNETILDNCDTVIYLASNSQSTSEWFSRGMGNRTCVRTQFGISPDGSASCSISLENAPAVSVSQLEMLTLGHFYVKRRGKNLYGFMTPFFLRTDVNHTESKPEVYPRAINEEKLKYEITTLPKLAESRIRDSIFYKPASKT